MSQIFNPYIAGNPIRKKEVFFGREEILKKVKRALSNPNTNAVVLSGQRRIGKTSILLQLESQLSMDEFLPIYFDLQYQAEKPLGEVLFQLANAIWRKLGENKQSQDEYDNDGYYFTNNFLPALYHKLGDKRPIILLDEFDVLDQIDENQLPLTAAAKALFPFLGNLMTHEIKLAFVFVIGRQVDDLNINTQSLFKTSIEIPVWLIDQKSTKKLIQMAEVNGSLVFNDETYQKIFSLTSGHPYLTQLLCQQLWEQAHEKENLEYPLEVIPSLIDDVIYDTLDAGGHALTWIWNGLSPGEKIFAAAFAELSLTSTEILENDITQFLTMNAARLRTRETDLAPIYLERRQILVQVGEKKYKFAVELFRLWIQHNHNLNSVKDELDRIQPLSENFYDMGWIHLNKKDLTQAINYFKEALKYNKNHFQARLALGESLLENGDTELAIEALRNAYNMDRNESSSALIRALLSKARAYEDIADFQKVIETCEEILRINPDEPIAIHMKDTTAKIFDFTKRMDELIEKSNEIFQKNLPLLVSAISDILSSKFVSFSLKPAILDWREGKIQTLNELNLETKQSFEVWLANTEAEIIINPIIHSWLSNLSASVENLVKSVYDGYKLEELELQLGNNLTDQVRVENFIISSYLYSIIVSSTIGSLFATLAAVFIPGSLSLVVLGLYSLYISVIRTKKNDDKKVGDLIIPWFIRKSILPDKKLDQYLFQSQNKIKSEFHESLANIFEHDIQEEIIKSITKYIQSEKERIITRRIQY